MQVHELRGAITKKKRENLGKIPKGGGLKKTEENSQFQFGNLKNLGGGSQLFKNVWLSIILQYYLYKKCLKFKKFWIWSEGEGGGSEVFKKFWNSKSSELSEGGGGQA